MLLILKFQIKIQSKKQFCRPNKLLYRMSKPEESTIPPKATNKDQDHFAVSQDQINMELLERDPTDMRKKGIDFVQYLKIILFGFQFNIRNWMHDHDPTYMKVVDQVMKMSPGYKSTQYIFTYFLLTSNLLNAFAMALLYPLPYSIIFTYIGFYLEDADLNQFWDYSPLVLIILTGVRASLIALLAKHAFVAPQGKFYWIVFVSTFVITLFFRNNYIYIILYVVSIFLSFYVKQDARRSSVVQTGDEVTQQQKMLEYREVRGVPQTYPGACIVVLIIFILGLWIYERTTDEWAFMVMLQFLFIGLLNNTKVMLIFFPLLFNQIYSIPYLKAYDLIGINLITPGSHIKPFFSFIGNDFSILTFILTYLCLYLPSILLVCVYIGYRKNFYTAIWNDSLKAMQAVSNGLILSMICYVIIDQTCSFGAVLYAAVCIYSVMYLYNLRQIYGALLGVFLIFSRAGILLLNKNEPLEKFVCLNEF